MEALVTETRTGVGDLPQFSGVFDGGDHVLALGQVVAAETFEAQPLTYHGRLYGTHARLE
jgi:flavin reductase (DIM6/NTAB) family NADH-FMN oxidoreductase RutF